MSGASQEVACVTHLGFPNLQTAQQSFPIIHVNRLSARELLALENNVKSKLASREPIDVDYWEGLLRSLQVWKAKEYVASGAVAPTCSE
jgi:hypothetical protein